MDLENYLKIKKNEGAIFIEEYKNLDDLSRDLKEKDNIELIFNDFSTLMQVTEILPKNKSINVINIGNEYTKEQLKKIQLYNNVWLYDSSNTKINKQLNRGFIATQVIVKPKLLIDRLDYYDKIIKHVRDNNCSPIEALSYIYSQVISYLFPRELKNDEKYSNDVDNKKYFNDHIEVNPSTKGWSICKNTALILNDKFIHCEGFSDMIVEITERLNMEGLDCQFMMINEGKELHGHAIIKTNINDIKYGIDGTYFSDPTKDSTIIKQAKDNNIPIETSTVCFMLNYEELLKRKEKLIISKNYEVKDQEKYSTKISPDILEDLFLMNSKNFNSQNIDSLNSLFNHLHKLFYDNERNFFKNQLENSNNIRRNLLLYGIEFEKNKKNKF